MPKRWNWRGAECQTGCLRRQQQKQRRTFSKSMTPTSATVAPSKPTGARWVAAATTMPPFEPPLMMILPGLKAAAKGSSARVALGFQARHSDQPRVLVLDEVLGGGNQVVDRVVLQSKAKIRPGRPTDGRAGKGLHLVFEDATLVPL